jgi:hypothetical protein
MSQNSRGAWAGRTRQSGYITRVGARSFAARKIRKPVPPLAGHFLSRGESAGRTRFVRLGHGPRGQVTSQAGDGMAGTARRVETTGGGLGANEPDCGRTPCSMMVQNLLRRASGNIRRRPCAALPAKLTLMSLKADTHVMAWITHQPTLTLMSHSTDGGRIGADRCRTRMT